MNKTAFRLRFNGYTHGNKYFLIDIITRAIILFMSF